MPGYYGPYYQPNTQMYQQPAPAQAAAPMQIQNGGFVSVRNEVEARNYPIAPGNSITFKDETAPYVYTKTMGFSQLDRPVFEKYKLVKEDAAESSSEAHTGDFDLKAMSDSIDTFKTEIEAIWDEIEDIRGMKEKPIRKSGSRRETKDDDE